MLHLRRSSRWPAQEQQPIPELYHAIVLAAGAGSRFGRNGKLTAPYGADVLLAGALRAACAAPVGGVIVVTGAHAAMIEPVVIAFRDRVRAPLNIVYCADHARGMSASLRCGFDALPDDAAGAFIFLGDMPDVPEGVAPMLIDAVRDGAVAAVPAFAGRFGHPVFLRRALFAGFASAAGDGEGRALLKGLGSGLKIVAIEDDGVIADVDTPGDLASLSAKKD